MTVDDGVTTCAFECFHLLVSCGDAGLRELASEAKASGLVVVVWSYPRGGGLSKEGQTALEVIAYGAQIAALLGAQIIKVKWPTARLELPEARKVYEDQNVPLPH